ncbi:HEPN domain-containing protein [Rhodococcus qingshengii]|uniref:HEPN domain-containing protein n=1 Tax=Rhodococcus qingshengii TaxID=334542 RepID=UPI00287F47D5|nr:HEPN domain-containing protein [Rhodococcus qingshengii]
MSRWSQGEADIEQLIKSGELQQISGSAADGRPVLEKATQKLDSARSVLEDGDPDSAFVLAYDAARTAATALLLQQGLRPTTTGGHVVVQSALKAQFGSGFRDFGSLRRRRNELEYFSRPGDFATKSESADSIEDAQRIVDAATRLIGQLGMF